VKIIDLIQSDHSYKMNGPSRLRIIKNFLELDERINFIDDVLKQIH